MKNLKVTKIDQYSIVFGDKLELLSDHDQDCCEHHFLSFSDLTLEDFKDLKFDFSNDNFFNRIDGYGIELVPIKGHSIKIPGYGSNNGYYSSNLDLILYDLKKKKNIKIYDISECQDISD